MIYGTYFSGSHFGGGVFVDLTMSGVSVVGTVVSSDGSVGAWVVPSVVDNVVLGGRVDVGVTSIVVGVQVEETVTVVGLVGAIEGIVGVVLGSRM